MNPKNTNKSPIHENMNAKITCDFGDERFRIAAARLENDIFVRTHLHTARIVVRITSPNTSRLDLYSVCFYWWLAIYGMVPMHSMLGHN